MLPQKKFFKKLPKFVGLLVFEMETLDKNNSKYFSNFFAVSACHLLVLDEFDPLD